MDRPPSLHRISAPLDAVSAEDRARQLEALTDPMTLRVLSALAVFEAGAGTVEAVAADLSMGTADVESRVRTLLDCGLAVNASTQHLAFSASPAAWTRFSRLFAPGVSPPGAPEPESVVWEAYPRAIRRIAEQLTRRYRATFARETIERYVVESYEELRHSPAGQQHLPMLVNRLVVERLGDIAATHLLPLAGVPEVLFVCVGNSGRSQIASSALIAMAGDRINVRSAGTRPSETVDSVVRRIMAEIGLHVGAAPKELQDAMVEKADYVVTMGCGDACPVLPGRRYLDWEVPDPVGRPVDEVRVIRDQIIDMVTDLVHEIDATRSRGRG